MRGHDSECEYETIETCCESTGRVRDQSNGEEIGRDQRMIRCSKASSEGWAAFKGTTDSLQSVCILPDGLGPRTGASYGYLQVFPWPLPHLGESHAGGPSGTLIVWDSHVAAAEASTGIGTTA